jgi:hypothetical protein
MRCGLPVALLATLAVLLVHTSIDKRLTYDEPLHLAYGYRFIVEGPAVHMAARLPVLALSALACVPNGCDMRDLDASEAQRLLVRAPTMGFALGLGALLYVWVKQALGAAAARLTLALYVLNPTVLAHGKQVTTDMATAFFTAASLYAAWRFARGGGWAALVGGILSTAGGALSKHTSLYLVALVPALAVWSASRGSSPTRPTASDLARGLGVTIAFVLGVLLIVNAVYRFEGTGTRSASVAFKSDAGRRVAGWDWPLPVPVPYALGGDLAAHWSERLRSTNYVLGDRSREGAWYAFPLMLILKTPLAFFALLAIAAARPVRRRGFPFGCFWIAPALGHLLLFSLGVPAQIGIRYILPSVALLIPVAGAAALAEARVKPLVLLALVAWHTISTLSYLPHPMSYFNELIGRRIHAYRFLADSNLDWEDRTADIARYRARHPELDIALEPPEPRTGDVLVGANRLLGIVGDERYRYLRRLQPVDHVGYSFLLFRVRADDLPRRRQRRGVGRGAGRRQRVGDPSLP